jgi:hypothetical protein
MTDFSINNIGFNVTDTFKDILEMIKDDQKKLLKEPSGLTEVLLISNYWGGNAMDLNKQKHRLLDFTGTTNEQAIKKILSFYSHKTHRRLIGDHTFFEGFYEKNGKAFIMLGS